MELHAGVKTYYAKNKKEWRLWLKNNGEKRKSVWLIIYRQSAAKKSIKYEVAVEDALCFGWIDSKPNKRDEESFYQFFAKRKPKSNWSKINKDRVSLLIAQGLMTDKGMEVIEQAKLNGAWSSPDSIENLELSPEFKKALEKNRNASKNFDAFPRSVKKGILEWIQNAKRQETREKRINETFALAIKNIRANQYKPK